MNKFFIIGLPRTGTTAIAKTLNSYDNIYLYSKSAEDYKDSESELFEPFALGNLKVELDWQNKLENVVEVEFKSKYNGFKLIPGDVVYAGDLIRDYNYDPLIVIRKNIWKSLFSKIGAVYISNDEKTIDAYTKSSKNTKADFSNFRHFLPRFIFFLKQYIKLMYEVETKFQTSIDKIYFEDFIKPNKTYENINNYFGQEIIFNLNYNDDYNVVDQYLTDANWTEEQYKILANEVNATVQRFDIMENKKAPLYLKEILLDNPFVK